MNFNPTLLYPVSLFLINFSVSNFLFLSIPFQTSNKYNVFTRRINVIRWNKIFSTVLGRVPLSSSHHISLSCLHDHSLNQDFVSFISFVSIINTTTTTIYSQIYKILKKNQENSIQKYSEKDFNFRNLLGVYRIATVNDTHL